MYWPKTKLFFFFAFEEAAVCISLRSCAQIHQFPARLGLNCSCKYSLRFWNAALTLQFPPLCSVSAYSTMRVNESSAHIWTAADNQNLPARDNGVEEQRSMGCHNSKVCGQVSRKKVGRFKTFSGCSQVMQTYNESRCNVRGEKCCKYSTCKCVCIMRATLVLFSQITCYFLPNAIVNAKTLMLVCRLVKVLIRNRCWVQQMRSTAV